MLAPTDAGSLPMIRTERARRSRRPIPSPATVDREDMPFYYTIRPTIYQALFGVYRQKISLFCPNAASGMGPSCRIVSTAAAGIPHGTAHCRQKESRREWVPPTAFYEPVSRERGVGNGRSCLKPARPFSVPRAYAVRIRHPAWPGPPPRWCRA